MVRSKQHQDISHLNSYLVPYKHRPEVPAIRFETPPDQQMKVLDDEPDY